MDKKYNKNLLQNARNLRKNMTPQERHLWFDFLRGYPMHFTRQKILGHYIADFYCANANLIIELDGSQHFDPEYQKFDDNRTDFLRKYGIEVLRIPNNEVDNNFYGVCEYIDTEIKKRLRQQNGD